MKRLVFVLLIGLIGYGFAQSDTADVPFSGVVDPVCGIDSTAGGSLALSGLDFLTSGGSDGQVSFTCNSTDALISAPNFVIISEPASVGAGVSGNRVVEISASDQGGNLSFLSSFDDFGGSSQTNFQFGAGSGATQVRFNLFLDTNANLPTGNYQYVARIEVTPL